MQARLQEAQQAHRSTKSDSSRLRPVAAQAVTATKASRLVVLSEPPELPSRI